MIWNGVTFNKPSYLYSQFTRVGVRAKDNLINIQLFGNLHLKLHPCFLNKTANENESILYSLYSIAPLFTSNT